MKGLFYLIVLNYLFYERYIYITDSLNIAIVKAWEFGYIWGVSKYYLLI